MRRGNENDDTEQRLLDALDQALEVASEFTGGSAVVPATEGASPESLLDQCLALCRAGSVPPEPVRTLHQMACTGGTLFAKCVASMPNVQLLSELEPLSLMQLDPESPRFCPTDLAMQLRQSTRGTSDAFLAKLFQDSLIAIHRETIANGQRLVLRDHAHSTYCQDMAGADRPSLRKLVAEVMPTLSMVFVRHPLDSYLGLMANQWIGFDGGLDAYCHRYLRFLDDHAGLPVLRYEDFLDDPEARMRGVCEYLQLPYSGYFAGMFDVYRLSGDSGRSGVVIEPRPRRELPDTALVRERDGSPHYKTLLQRLDYEP